MRPIAAPATLRFPDAVVAAPGQGPMQHLLPGCDLTVVPDAPGRFTARPRRPLRGHAAEREGARAEREALAPLKVGIAGAWLIKQVVMVGIGWHKSRIVDKPPC